MSLGYLYRPMLKGKPEDFTPTPEDLGLSRGEQGQGSTGKCHHPTHGKADVCAGCGARFGKVWWMKYYVNGRPVRESTETEKETEARKILNTKDGRAASGLPIVPRADRVTYDELAGDLVRHYRTTGERDLNEAGRRLKHLTAFFAGRRAVEITPRSSRPMWRSARRRRRTGAA